MQIAGQLGLGFVEFSTLNLIKNGCLFDLVIASEKKNLRQYFGCNWIIIGKRKIQAATLLGIDWHNTNKAPRKLVNNATPQVDPVVGELACDESVSWFHSNIRQLQHRTRLAHDIRPHVL